MLSIKTPAEVAELLAERLRQRRLDLNWSREELSQRSGVTVASIRRFENTSEVSLARLLQLCMVLGSLDDFDQVLAASKTPSIAELKRQQKKRKRLRARRKSSWLKILYLKSFCTLNKNPHLLVNAINQIEASSSFSSIDEGWSIARKLVVCFWICMSSCRNKSLCLYSHFFYFLLTVAFHGAYESRTAWCKSVLQENYPLHAFFWTLRSFYRSKFP